MCLELTKVRAQSMGGITGRIQEPAVAALLIGKLSRAQELRVVFRLDPFSHYPHGSQLPAHRRHNFAARQPHRECL